ncbi:MAG TPA: preprotein translocase subunit YajC [candidate division WOR-3 bacterium]|uniref:Preprotein translocase subunit YajC n=1 Tax=candidate division WOR-3 bacterium TaxID=2052148 RepID=A0A7V0T403_UNCW3|nr:preprotein translocase subunit YajC [candidate division WOR-3 bacterium]
MFNIALAQDAPAAPAAGGMGSIIGFLPIILIFVVLYFLMILPQQRRQKKHNEMLKALKRGDRVVLSSGIHGIITTVRDSTFIVKVADSTEIEVDRGSVGARIGGQ